MNGTAGGTYGMGCGAGTGCGAAGRCESTRSSSVRSVETRASWWEIAAKSAESREMTAWCGSVMLVMIAPTRAGADE